MKRKNMWKILLIITIFAAFAACKTDSTATKTSEPPPMPVGALMNEYKQSKDATVKKYTGKTLIVKGYAMIAPIMPNGADDAGILVLTEKGGDPLMSLTCQFKQSDKAGFEQIKGDQMVSVTGTFDDSTSTALKNCMVVKVE